MPKARTSFTIEEEILEQARHLSDSQFRSVSQTVEMLLADYIEQHRLNPQPPAPAYTAKQPHPKPTVNHQS